MKKVVALVALAALAAGAYQYFVGSKHIGSWTLDREATLESQRLLFAHIVSQTDEEMALAATMMTPLLEATRRQTIAHWELDFAVNSDGTWQMREHTALNGVIEGAGTWELSSDDHRTIMLSRDGSTKAALTLRGTQLLLSVSNGDQWLPFAVLSRNWTDLQQVSCWIGD